MELLTMLFKNTIFILVGIYGLVSLLFIMYATFKSMYDYATGKSSD